MSICECVQKGSPPASTSRVLPSGRARKRESPWPTSIAVISKTAARSCACGNRNCDENHCGNARRRHTDVGQLQTSQPLHSSSNALQGKRGNCCGRFGKG